MTTGAIGCPMFTGVRLRDVLNYCGLAEDAVYLGYYGADTHTSGDLIGIRSPEGFRLLKPWSGNQLLPGQ